jgi:hypothetical protein
MQTHPSYAHFIISDRTRDITRQVKEMHLAQSVRVLEEAQNGRSPARLSLAGLRSLVSFGNGRAVQGAEADGVASHPELVNPLKPEEQCC